MKLKKILYIFIFLLSFNLISAEKNEKPKKIIITTQNWKPYNYKNETDEVKGIATKILKKVLNKMDVEYEIKVYSWTRAQLMVEMGEADAFYTASKNDKRDKYAIRSDAMVDQSWYWYYSKKSNVDISSKSFKESSLVDALFGSNMYNHLKKNNYNLIGSTYTMDHLVKNLNIGRVEAILVNNIVAEEYFKINNIDSNKYNKTEYKNKPLGIYFSKKFLKNNPKFLEKFNKNLDIILNEYVNK